MSRLMVTVSGVRGEIGQTLTPESAARFGAAFGTMLGAGKTVVLARDSRPSGPMVRNAVASGLLACGVHVIDVGVVTTPGAALMTRRLKADGGVVITASHNPIQWNGIKFLQPTGVALSVEQAGQLKQVWQSGQYAYAAPAYCGQESANDTTHDVHVKAVLALTDVPAVAGRKFKVVLDSINGAGCAATAILLEQLGCQLVHLNGEPTGLFAHTPEPTKENLTGLCQAVAKHRAAVGFAQDPDADRLALVDEAGQYIGEEYTLALCAAYVLGRRPGDVVTNLSTSRMVDAVARQYDRQVYRTPVGEANVAAKLLEAHCVLGGEGNGGVIDPRVVPVRDSLVGIALILSYLAETGQPLSALAGRLPRYEMVKTKFPCPEAAAAKVCEKTKGHFAGRKGAKFNDSDGLRIDLPEGWVHVRASNTEPIMRIIAEADTAEAAQALIDDIRALADAAIAKAQ